MAAREPDVEQRIARTRTHLRTGSAVGPTEEARQRLVASLRRLGADEAPIRALLRPAGRGRRARGADPLPR